MSRGERSGATYLVTAIDCAELADAEGEEGKADRGDGQELGPDGLEACAAEDDGLRES